MTSAVLTIPEDPAAVPGWLERQLLGPDLDRLAAELAAVHNPPPDTAPVLEDVLGSHAPAVFARGLAALPRPTLGLLLRNPALLPELRDQILTDGGPYWDAYLRGELTPAANRVAERVRAAVGGAPPATPRGRFPAWLGHAATAFATAAAVLVAVYAVGGLRPPEASRAGPGTEVAAVVPAWGFQKVEQLPKDTTDAAALLALADLAGEWGKKTPATPAELHRRLIEFREGCGAIQLASLPLTEPQAKWLKLRCGDWSAEIDGHLRNLEETRDAAAVRAAADRTVDRIVGELRARAKTAVA